MRRLLQAIGVYLVLYVGFLLGQSAAYRQMEDEPLDQ